MHQEEDWRKNEDNNGWREWIILNQRLLPAQQKIKGWRSAELKPNKRRIEFIIDPRNCFTDRW